MAAIMGCSGRWRFFKS